MGWYVGRAIAGAALVCFLGTSGAVRAGYLDEIRAFFGRNIVAARAAGQVPRQLDADEAASHLLGVVLGIRVLARTRARRRVLEAVAQPALALLDPPKSRKH